MKKLITRPDSLTTPRPACRHTRRAGLWIMVALFGISSIWSSGCSLDFDQFNTRDNPIADAAPDAGEEQDTPGEDATGDTAGPNDDASQDAAQPDAQTPTEALIGATCQQDTDCAGGHTCLGGYCTTGCDADATCPQGSRCHQFNYGSLAGSRLCLADCVAEPGASFATSCAGVAGREDLHCVTPNQWPQRALSAESDTACLPDRDGDSVADPLDNCPDTPNAQQYDRDGDGVGDACDPKPLCHALSVQGVLDYGTIDYAASSFALPASSAQNWVPIAGGVDAEGNPVRTLVALDRVAGQWKTLPELPFASLERQLVTLGSGQYLLTPGKLSAGAGAFNRATFIARDGSTHLRVFSDGGLYDSLLGASGYGQVVALGYESAGDTSWRAALLRLTDGAMSTLTSDSAMDRVAWNATTTLQGAPLFYSDLSDAQNTMRLLQVGELGQGVRTTSLALPTPTSADSGGHFQPLLIPAGGGTVYVMDRASGMMLRVVLSDNTFEHIPGYDLSIELGGDPRFVSMVDSMGFIVIDRPSEDSPQLRAREFFLGCMPDFDQVDTDNDGVPDILDNCPLHPNPDQRDTDFDRLGDVCDADADGDGIPNGSDFVNDEGRITSRALDTDNDGVDNADDDDVDGDGIPNAADRYPIDTDNDGIPNWLDADIDGDGYTNAEEAEAGSDPLNPLSFPGAGFLTFIRDDGSSRQVHVGALDALASARVLASSAGVRPHEPRFLYGASALMTLAGAPDVATGIDVLATHPDDSTAAQQTDLGVKLRAVAALRSDISSRQLRSLHAIHANPQHPGAWLLSAIGLEDRSFTPWAPGMDELRSLDGSADTLLYLAAPAGCTACLQPFNIIPDDSLMSPAPIIEYELLKSRLSPSNRTTLVVVDPAQEGNMGWYAGDTYRPAGITQIDSFIATDTDAAHLLLSGRRDAQSPYELWLYNQRVQQWFLLLDGDDNLVEIDWAPQIPTPAAIGFPDTELPVERD